MPSSSGSTTNPSCSGAGCSSGKVIGLVVFVTFAGYWISEWIKNTIHTSVAGVYGSWYFCAGKPGGIPKGSSMGAFKRATTYSFGSISLGSLIVAIINMIRQACSIAQRQSASDGKHHRQHFLLLFRVHNRPPRLGSAIHQQIRVLSHRTLWQAILRRSKRHLDNDERPWDRRFDQRLPHRSSPHHGRFVCWLSMRTALLPLSRVHQTRHTTRVASSRLSLWPFHSSLDCKICQIFVTPIGSGVDTIFVAMGWDPQVAVSDHPEFWNKLIRVYPKVQHVIQARHA